MNDVKKPAGDFNPFKEAWFRLQNEDTNQSIDYSYIETVKKDNGVEDGEEEAVEEDEDEDGEGKQTKETIFLAGRLYREDTIIKSPEPSSSITPRDTSGADIEDENTVITKWIYERWNKVVTSDNFPDIAKSMGSLLQRSEEEVNSNAERIKEAKDVLVRAAENKKGKKDDAIMEDEQKTTIRATEEDEVGDLNLNDPEDFAKALNKEVPRPFTFGPIEFGELDLSQERKAFDVNEQLQRIVDSLDLHMDQPSCCIRGHRIQVRNRSFKRRSTMLKHGRFMQNLQVTPVFPQIVDAAPEDEEPLDGDENDE